MHTPTPLAPMSGSSPAAMDGLGGLGRARGGTLGGKSVGPSEVNTPALSGLGLGLGVGGNLNTELLGSGGMGDRDIEAWKAQQTREIVEALGNRWGRVSQESVERCAKRIGGLECVWVEEGGQGRTLSIAASEVVIDIEWVGERVKNVTLNYAKPSTGDITNDEIGSEVLRKDLIGWDEQSRRGYVMLDGFVKNLHRLVRTDQLGGDKLSCFEALHGIHSSLQKLYTYELAKAKDEKKLDDVEMMVTCQESGKPALHSTRSIGLRIDYWEDRRLVFSKKRKQSSTSGNKNEPDPEGTKTWTLQIECEDFDATQYPPLRVSDAWISKDIMTTVPLDETLMTSPAPIIDWQEPPATLIPLPELNTGADAMDIDMGSGTTQPNIRFIAKLDPPVTLPLKLAADILSNLGQPILQTSMQWTTFPALLFSPDPSSVADTSKDTSRRFSRDINSFSTDGNCVSQSFDISFYTQRDVVARTIYELPFSHPKQLVSILPYLRQWALFGRILQRSVDSDPNSKPASTTKIKPTVGLNQKSTTSSKQVDAMISDDDSDDDSDSEDDASTSRAMKKGSQSIDLTFSYHPTFQRIDLDCLFPLPSSSATTSVKPSTKEVRFSILPNGVIGCTCNSTGPDDKMQEDEGDGSGNPTKEEAELRTVLTMSEDLGVVGAWVLTRWGSVESS